MKARNLAMMTAMTAIIGSAAFAQIVTAGKIQPIEPINKVEPLPERDEFVICGGTPPSNDTPASAYYNIITDASGRITRAVGKPVRQIGGGSYACAKKLASGEADAALIQDDMATWLVNSSSPLAENITYGEAMLTEAFMAFCARDNKVVGSQEDFGWLGQNDKVRIAIPGGPGAGANITLSAIAAFDKDWRKPKIVYSEDWNGAFSDVTSGRADCVFGVSDPSAEQWEKYDDQYGEFLRLLEIYDKDFWKIKGFTGQQLYGQLQVDEDTPLLDDFLAWRGNGKGRWSPEMPGVNASVYYRSDAVSNDKRSALNAALKSQQRLIEMEK